MLQIILIYTEKTVLLAVVHKLYQLDKEKAEIALNNQ